MHELHYNGSSDLRQLHKQDNIPPLIIHRAFRLVILILYFPLVRICQYHPDNWTLNAEISRQDPVRPLVKLSYWFQAGEDRIIIHYGASRLANYQNEYHISKWQILMVTVMTVVCGSKSRSSCSIYLATPVIPVVSQQQTGVSVTIHLSTRQSLQPKVVSLSSLYIYFSPHSTLKNTKSSKEFSLPATLLKMMNRHKNEFPQYF